MKKAKSFILTLLVSLLSTVMYAQEFVCSGTVVDEQGEPIIGASVFLKGSKNGVFSDIKGEFRLENVAEGSPITISYIGCKTVETKAAAGMRVVMREDNEMLGEVVVVGYGVQKKSVVTASIAKVSSDELAATAPVRMDNALKGLAAGVTVTSSSGQPGAAARIRVRGIGTINNSDPLYIVDGMPIEGGLDYVNPSDIESIEVLKDAASGAIYGARAANGVVLVTTKSGKKGKVKVNYNFSYGWQSKWRKRDVLNATEYAVMMNEGYINAGMKPLYADPYHLKDAMGNQVTDGTDWQDAVFNDNAPVMNHDLTVSGATDKVNYYLSLGYYTQEGIVGGNFDRSNYQRLSLRSNTRYNVLDLSKERKSLNKIDIIVNLSYARIKSKGIDTNSQWGSPLGSALALSPVLTPTLTGEAADAQDKFYRQTQPDYPGPILSPRGNPYTIAGTTYNEMVNPLAALSLPGAQNWSHKFVANFAAEMQIWDGLKYRISYGADMSFWGNNSHTILYYLTTNNKATHTSASQESDRGTVWQIENVLTYDKTFGDHTFNVVLGQSAMKNTGWTLGASRWNLIDLNKPYINFASGLAEKGERDGWGGPSNPHTLSSMFARLSYNYAERYMFQATVRRDGSSRFGLNNKYATFPSLSLGWNITNEPFMRKAPQWLSNMKLRASWGKNGNENIDDFRYAVFTSTGNNYIFGRGESVVNGVKANGLSNPDLKWEESEQTDIGLDLGFMDNALTFSVDYYIKKTNGMLMTMAIPSYVGETKPIGNVGKMENSGVEFELGYKFRVSDAQFSIRGNASYLKNKLVNLGNDTGWAAYDSFQSVGTITRAMNGEPFPYFYGLKTDGIFQTQQEVDSYVGPDGKTPVQPDARPGYVRFVDINRDGVIDDNDRTKLGKGMPDWTFGVNLSASWRRFDLSMMWQGTAGNDVFDATRRIDINSTNLPSWMLGRWTGPGTSDKYPLFIVGDSSDNWKSSDLYVYDGSYLRLKNIELGYTLPDKIAHNVQISRLRLFVSAENLLTFTKYHGFDPEISSGGTSLGVDYGVYPQARVWRIGFNLEF